MFLHKKNKKLKNPKHNKNYVNSCPSLYESHFRKIQQKQFPYFFDLHNIEITTNTWIVS